jgi:uncharacterized protein (DUF4415 family)
MKKLAAEPYRDIDFATAKRGAVIPLETGKTKISIRLDNGVIEYFRSVSDGLNPLLFDGEDAVLVGSQLS